MMAEAKQTAKARPKAPKPMSPHLSIYRFRVNMVLSIMHRITGVANYWGSFLLMAWLVAAAMGDKEFNLLSSFLGSPIGLVILVGFTWSAPPSHAGRHPAFHLGRRLWLLLGHSPGAVLGDAFRIGDAHGPDLVRRALSVG